MTSRVQLCGALAVLVAGHDVTAALPGGRATALFAYLVATREASRDELIAALWPQAPPRDPAAVLRPLLSRIRSALPESATLDGRERLRLALPEPVWVDVEAAASHVERARSAAGDWSRAAEEAESAAELIRAGFLPGLDADWANARRRAVEELFLEALELAARSRLAAQDTAAAERVARELVARSPFRETGHRFLMEALAHAGNAAEALRVYDELRVLLREELGAAPAAEVQALHQRLLTGERTPVQASRVALPAVLAPAAGTAFVGRSDERDVLRAAWDEARAGRRRLVLVGGDPGIGKTRLLSEFAREAHAGGSVLFTACTAEPLISYQPFVEALGGLSQLAADPALDPEARRYRLFEAVSSELGAMARRAPLLLVLDDLHWADRPTLQLLRHVIRAPDDVPLLVAGAYREGEVGPGHPLAELYVDLRRDGLARRASLTGLPERDVRSLIATHAGFEAPPGVVQVVHRHTDGNPFFVEEVMRHLIETGVLYEREGRWTSALTPDEIGVPDGVRDVVLARVARLSEPCRAALAEGAVLGRRFAFDLLSAMSEAGADALIGALEEALAAQLIVEVDGPAYAFTHALVREALYERLSAPRRERLHARAAAALEAVSGEDQLGALALHLRASGSVGDPGKALGFSIRAGARAAELSAWEDAVAHWDGALAVMERLGGRERERAQLLISLADVLLQSGDVGRRIGALERALAIYEALGDEQSAAKVQSRLGMALCLVDSIYAEHLDIRRAFEHFEAARPVLTHGRAAGHLENGVANAFIYRLGVEPGLEAAARAMEVGEASGDELLWTGGAVAYGWNAVVAGRLAEGLAAIERAIEVADRHRRSFLMWMACNTRGQLTWGLGAPTEAEGFLRRPLELPYFGRTSYEQEIADGLGRCHISRGELEAARALAPTARPAWITHALKPQLDLWDGRWDGVLALAETTLAVSRRTGNRWDEFGAHHLAARALALRGDADAAVARLEQALAIVVDGRAVYFELWARPDLARALVAAGRAPEAREHVERCRSLLAGEDWRGRAGHVDLAEAVVLTAEGALDAPFAAAEACFARYELRGDLAETLLAAGQAWLDRLPGHSGRPGAV